MENLNCRARRIEAVFSAKGQRWPAEPNRSARGQRWLAITP